MRAIGAVTAHRGVEGAPQPRLVEAAHEFEAQLMKELLRPMMNGDDDDETGSCSALRDFAGEILGGALSRGGGFGIAGNILHSLSRNDKDMQDGSVVGRAPAEIKNGLKEAGELPISSPRRIALWRSETAPKP